MLERRERLVDRLEDVLGREVEVALPDADLGLDDDLAALGRRELHRLAEARLAAVRRAAVDVGVVDMVTPASTRGIEQPPDLRVAHLGMRMRPRMMLEMVRSELGMRRVFMEVTGWWEE